MRGYISGYTRKEHRRQEEMYIYAIQCSYGRVYVGTTNCPQRRIMQHVIAVGAEWTKMYPPIRVIGVYPLRVGLSKKEVIFYETQHTLAFMRNYGWTNVRGGVFIRVSNEKTADMLKQRKNQIEFNYNSRELGL